MRELGGDGPLEAAIGPGAGPCCYEVGEEVHAAFADHGRTSGAGATSTSRRSRASSSQRAGVDVVHDVGLCTICGDPTLFFSHRRDHGVTGRQAGVAWLS